MILGKILEACRSGWKIQGQGRCGNGKNTYGELKSDMAELSVDMTKMHREHKADITGVDKRLSKVIDKINDHIWHEFQTGQSVLSEGGWR